MYDNGNTAVIQNVGEKNLKKLILGVDAGNFEGKVAGPYGALSFKTNISENVDLKVEEVFGEDDMRWEIDGKKGLAGTIALYENRFGSKSMYGETKAHWNTKARVLLSIYQYIKRYDLSPSSISLVTGQPYKGHNEDEKEKLRKMLLGSHPIVVNGEAMTIKISEVGIAPEGVGAFWGSNQSYPTCKVLDIGSGTVNAIGLIDYRVVNSFSDTFNYGTEILQQDQVARGVIQDTTGKGWVQSDKVLVAGGTAGTITPQLIEHYPNAEVLVPTLVLNDETTQVLEPKFANAVGFYTLALGNFK